MENKAEKSWTEPIDGVIHVPDHLDQLFNRLGTQLRFHTISDKGEAETVASMTKIADDHASQQCAELQEINRVYKNCQEKDGETIKSLQSENESLKKRVEEQTYQLEFAEREVAKRNALLEDVVYDRVQMQEVKRRIEDILNLPF